MTIDERCDRDSSFSDFDVFSLPLLSWILHMLHPAVLTCYELSINVAPLHGLSLSFFAALIATYSSRLWIFRIVLLGLSSRVGLEIEFLPFNSSVFFHH